MKNRSNIIFGTLIGLCLSTSAAASNCDDKLGEIGSQQEDKIELGMRWLENLGPNELKAVKSRYKTAIEILGEESPVSWEATLTKLIHEKIISRTEAYYLAASLFRENMASIEDSLVSAGLGDEGDLELLRSLPQLISDQASRQTRHETNYKINGFLRQIERELRTYEESPDYKDSSLYTLKDAYIVINQMNNWLIAKKETVRLPSLLKFVRSAALIGAVKKFKMRCQFADNKEGCPIVAKEFRCTLPGQAADPASLLIRPQFRCRIWSLMFRTQMHEQTDKMTKDLSRWVKYIEGIGKK